MDKKQDAYRNSNEVSDPPRIKKVIDFIKQYFKKVDDLNVLECGIMRGGVADKLSREGAKCFGIDIHERKVDNVKTYAADLNEGFPNFGVKFDIIFAGELIEHLYDDSGFIKNAKNELRSGGLLIITTPNLNFSFNRILMLFGKMPIFSYADGHYHIYNRKTLEDMIKKEGFEIQKTISSHVLVSTRRNKIFKIFEILGDIFPSFGAHLIIFAKKI